MATSWDERPATQPDRICPASSLQGNLTSFPYDLFQCPVERRPRHMKGVGYLLHGQVGDFQLPLRHSNLVGG